MDNEQKPSYAVMVKVKLHRIYPPVGSGQQGRVEGALDVEESAEGATPEEAYAKAYAKAEPVLKAVKCIVESGIVTPFAGQN